MKEITPPDTEKDWEFLGAALCHVKEDGMTPEGKIQYTIDFSQDVEKNWVGAVRVFCNPQNNSIMCRDFDFFEKGVVLKTWGFAEDFNKKEISRAILYQRKWYLKEENDLLFWYPNFEQEGKIKILKGATFELKSSKKEIVVTISP